MKRFSTVSMFLILFLIANNLFAQKNDFNFVGAGARAAGMGNAFIGVSDDASAISWNPAGLSQLLRPEASVVSRYTTRDVEFKDFTGEQVTNSLSTFALNFGSLVFPFKGEYNPVVGLSFQNQLDFTAKETWFEYWEDLGGEVEVNGETNLLVHAISAAYSMKFGFFHAGLTFSNWLSTGEEKATYVTPFYGDISGKVEHSISGQSFVLGLLADFEALSPTLPLRIGLKFSPSFELEDETKTTIPDFEYVSEIKNTYEMPSVIGLGLSFRLLDELTLAADYEMIGVEDKHKTEFGRTSNLSESNEDMNQFRIGAEYLVLTNTIIIPLRAGYKNNPTMRGDLVDYNIEGFPIYSGQVMASSLNFGAGLIFNNFALDVAYEYFDFVVKNKADGINENQTHNFFTFSGIVYF